MASRFFQVWALAHQANVYGCFEGESFQGEPSIRDCTEESMSAHQCEAGLSNDWLKRKQNLSAQNGLNLSPAPLGLIHHQRKRQPRMIRVQGRERVGGCPGLSLGSKVTLRRGDGNLAAPQKQLLVPGFCAIFSSLSPFLSSAASSVRLSRSPAPAEKLAAPLGSHQLPGPSASWTKGRFKGVCP